MRQIAKEIENVKRDIVQEILDGLREVKAHKAGEKTLRNFHRQSHISAKQASSSMTNNALYFITGSSGSGKTTLLKGVVKSTYPNLLAYHFDDLGIPSLEEMNTKYGGPEQWQAYNAHEWVKKVAQMEDASLIVLDGQVRPTVILEAANQVGFPAIHITLIECSHQERRRRLIEERAQPELDRLDMYAWAAYLRGQADALSLEIIDTTHLTLAEAIEKLANSIAHFAAEAGVRLDRNNETKFSLQS